MFPKLIAQGEISMLVKYLPILKKTIGKILKLLFSIVSIFVPSAYHLLILLYIFLEFLKKTYAYPSSCVADRHPVYLPPLHKHCFLI